jgi:hypothetical protein
MLKKKSGRFEKQIVVYIDLSSAVDMVRCVFCFCNCNLAVLFSLHRRRAGGSLSGGPVFPFAKAASI